MIVVSDTSVVSNLYLVGCLDLLPKLFEEVFMPQQVFEELMALKHFGTHITPIVSASFLVIKAAENQQLVTEFLKSIDEGEAQAIVLAIELKADLLLIDERKGRAIAEEHGLKITGLLGILLRAKQHGFLNKIRPVLDELRSKANFFMSDKLYFDVIKLAGE